MFCWENVMGFIVSKKKLGNFCSPYLIIYLKVREMSIISFIFRSHNFHISTIISWWRDSLENNVKGGEGCWGNCDTKKLRCCFNCFSKIIIPTQHNRNIRPTKDKWITPHPNYTWTTNDWESKTINLHQLCIQSQYWKIL